MGTKHGTRTSGARMGQRAVMGRILACLPLALSFAAGGPGAQAADTTSPAPLVLLDARDATAGTDTWANGGTLGAFERVGTPGVRAIGGVRAVEFDGSYDAYRGPSAPAGLLGAGPRTIEVWAFNPNAERDEETLVSWGKRGGADLSMMAFGWGSSETYGAASHWTHELGWQGTPAAGRWHFLAYTYDGVTARVYDNGREKSSRAVSLATAGGPIVVGTQTGDDGKLEWGQGATLEIASVRVLAVAESASQVAQDFSADAARFGAVTGGASADTGGAGAPLVLPVVTNFNVPDDEFRQYNTAVEVSSGPLLPALAANLAFFPTLAPAVSGQAGGVAALKGLPPFVPVPLSGPLVRIDNALWTAAVFTVPAGERRPLRLFVALPANVHTMLLVPTGKSGAKPQVGWYRIDMLDLEAAAPPGLTGETGPLFLWTSDAAGLQPGQQCLLCFLCGDQRPDPVQVSLSFAPNAGAILNSSVQRSSVRAPMRVRRVKRSARRAAAAVAAGPVQDVPADELNGLKLGYRKFEPDMDAGGQWTGTAYAEATVTNDTRFTLTSLTVLVEDMHGDGDPTVAAFTSAGFRAGTGESGPIGSVRRRLLPADTAWVSAQKLRFAPPGSSSQRTGYWMEVIGARGQAAPVQRPTPEATLAVAAKLGDLAAAQAVLAAHPQAASAVTDGETPLHQAVIHDHLGMARLLLDRGAPVDAKDSAGLTPLLQAIEWDRLSLVRLLLARHADPRATDRAGHAALDLARDQAGTPGGWVEIADAVAAAGRGELPAEPGAPEPPWGLEFYHPAAHPSH